MTRAVIIDFTEYRNRRLALREDYAATILWTPCGMWWAIGAAWWGVWARMWREG